MDLKINTILVAILLRIFQVAFLKIFLVIFQKKNPQPICSAFCRFLSEISHSSVIFFFFCNSSQTFSECFVRNSFKFLCGLGHTVFFKYLKQVFLKNTSLIKLENPLKIHSVNSALYGRQRTRKPCFYFEKFSSFILFFLRELIRQFHWLI